MEKWLKARTAATEVTHVVHAPSNPPGWTAGKWGEWYPDVLGANGKLTVAVPKPYWQSGWLKQHDRLIGGDVGNEGAHPAGDQRRHARDRDRPHAAQRHPRPQGQSGQRRAVGTDRHTARSAGRRSGAASARSPRCISTSWKQVKPIEQHGFTIVDFLPDKIVLRFFKWDLKTQPVEAIDTLEPFHTAELTRAA